MESKSDNKPPRLAPPHPLREKVKRKKRKQLMLAGVVLMLVSAAALVMLLPRLVIDDTFPSASLPTSPASPEDRASSAPTITSINQPGNAQVNRTEPSSPGPIEVSTPSAGESFALDLPVDQENHCEVTWDMMQAYFPQMQYFDFAGVPYMGNDLDDYLANSYHLARLIGSGGQEGSTDVSGRFSVQDDATSPRCLLIFRDLTTLCGYAIGAPEQVTEDAWRLQVTYCDYDFRALYQQQAQDFAAAGDLPYIPPAEMTSCGAAWFLYSFNLRTDDEQTKQTQLSYLWNQFSSPHRERHSRSISSLASRRPGGSADDVHWRYYLLLDEDYELIGYSKLSSNDQL